MNTGGINSPERFAETNHNHEIEEPLKDMTTHPKLGGCQLIDLPRIQDPRGNLTFIESNKQVPFSTKRVFYLYDVPGGSERGGHALRTCHQFLIAMSGSFDVILYDGKENERVHLNRSYIGLYIPPLIWREMDNFSSGSVCLALASELYDENDYLREYNKFLNALQETGMK